MRGWSIPLGRYFGVEVRLHSIFALALPVMMVLSAIRDGGGARGVALWLLLLFAVLVRETSRALAEAAAGHGVTEWMLLPTGAVPADDRERRTRWERGLSLVGPLSNFAAGITMALLMYAATPSINLFEMPWVTPLHLVRSAIWAQVLLGGLHLLPASPLDAGMVFRRQLRRIRGDEAGTRASLGLAHAVALLLVVTGAALGNVWLLIMGCSLLLSGRADTLSRLGAQAAGTVTAGEVMLAEFATLSASDTLSDALHRSVHSLQDVFPVVRGAVIVGSVSRDALSQTLRTDGNGYVQGAMTRTVGVLAADDPLMPALAQMRAGPASQMLSVVRDEQVVGILTPDSLTQAMSQLGHARRVADATRTDRNG